MYGLTETTAGPVRLAQTCGAPWIQQQSNLKSRQGVGGQMLEGLMVADPETLQPVPQDGVSIGEVMMRGNNVMKGYLKNPAATQGPSQAAGSSATWRSGQRRLHTD